jgi:DNA-binding MarR family transcriptional regulator
MSVVWESAEVDSSSELLVLLTIADHADDNGENAYPGIARIARRCRLSGRRVQQLLNSLEQRGLLMVERQAGGRSDLRDDRRPNRYSITVDGVKHVAPREDNGVKPVASRKGVDGVKPTSPDTLVVLSTNETLELMNSSKENHQEESKRLANFLADALVANGCKRPSVTDRWVSGIEKIIRIDGRSPEQVEAAISWSQKNEFWRSVILSPDALRRHYEKMRLQAQAGSGKRVALDGIGDYLKETT